MRIWKCDTKWGGSSILEIFADFRIAFFGTDAARIGHHWDVRPGDLIGISQGTRIIAIAEAISECEPLEKIGKEILSRNIIKEYVEDSGVAPYACRLSNVLWLKKAIINDRRGGRFYELKEWNPDYQEVLRAWENYKTHPKEVSFDIEAGKRILIGKSAAEGLLAGDNIRYVIPVYQRAYAWGEDEIVRLLDDIADGTKSKEPRFIGSIQVSAPRKLSNSVISYELIDGQQRLTTLLILLRQLGIDYTSNLRTVVNAGSAQRDWDDFKTNFDVSGIERKFPLNKYVQASAIIKSWLAAQQQESGGMHKRELVDYIEHYLYFVVIQTKAGISKTIQIFNVINTAGMDLDASDLFKIRFYEYLTKESGPDESVFAEISSCYQRVSDYNREVGEEVIPMSAVIAFYQKVLVAKFGLNSELFSMSSQRFFEQLFDCLVEGKKWQGFHNKGIVMALQDLKQAIDILIGMDKKTKHCTRLQIFRKFLWETRYGNVVVQYPALACYFKTINGDEASIVGFTEKLFKKLVPPSLYFGKVVNDVRFAKLHRLLLAFPQGPTAMAGVIDEPWTIRGVSEDEMLNHGLNQELASSRPWKNLACKLVEFLLSKSLSDKEIEKRLFETAFDIEHIQSFKDDENADAIWEDWGWEINGIGNLSMLEYDLNRSIRNCHEKKEDAYKRSRFVSIAKIRPLLNNGRWSLKHAQTRRKELTGLIEKYILGNVKPQGND